MSKTEIEHIIFMGDSLSDRGYRRSEENFWINTYGGPSRFK